LADATCEHNESVEATRRLMYARRRCDDESQLSDLASRRDVTPAAYQLHGT